ncbi:3-oxoacyl-[acyl-carrier protein] reductase [Promicromonospora sp. AC04]|uniref:SDR family NAD(P)-dependent oxidoreductase n=1 Tax=Promicromonospora sp. AC04 TaxID=2135723 RepID=UPI000D3361B9|nr:SDR family oxidoreductase [Promicromonospora sp. AC04]PUB32333.1 3-oxoacyl-[acyl-carrier protein] reductase [Promicromonospora sp. AC04]
MDTGLQERTVIVTGASGGVGRHIATAFGAEGANVVVTYRNARDEAQKVADEIGDRAVVVQYDQADPAAAEALVAAAVEATGRVDVLVNNAVAWGGMAPFDTVPDEEWTGLIRSNIEGAIRLTRAVTPLMRAAGWGRLIHLSSSLATDGAPGAEYYAAAKAALHGFSRSVAFSLGRDGDLLSNVALLGLTRTATNTHIIEEVGQTYGERSPLGRLLDASEVATAVVWLGSAANTAINGQVIGMTGGA